MKRPAVPNGAKIHQLEPTSLRRRVERVRPRLRVAAGVCLSVGVMLLTPSMLPSCSSAPPQEPTRIMERAERVDVVCMQVFKAGLAIAPVPLAASECVVPEPNATYPNNENHMFALVTQTARGEVGVVDLTAGGEVDVDIETPGKNLIPVGRLPVDLKISPDRNTAFVAASEPTKPAIYAIPTTRILGNAQGLPGSAPPALTEWLSCSLPDRPVALASIPDATDPNAPGTLAVALGGSRLVPSRIVTIDIAAFRATVKAGALLPCPLVQAVSPTVPPFADATEGPAWDDGVGYLAKPVDATGDLPTSVASCASPIGDAGSADASDAGINDAGPSDSGASDAGTTGGTTGGTQGLALAASDSRLGSMIRQGNRLYVTDLALPLIHVFRIDGATLVAETPLSVTSALDPLARPTASALAASPTTTHGKTFLYAIENNTGSLIVYDISDPLTSPRVPLRRPHSETNPFQAVDRLTFSAPIATIGFVEQGYGTKKPDGTLFTDRTYCDPRPTLDRSITPSATLSSQGGQDKPPGPVRLRGIFAVATLINGSALFVDVEDWDAACRRPGAMVGLARNSYAPLPTDDPSNPYALPIARTGTDIAPIDFSTNEAYFPVSAPHRLRSSVTLQNERGLNSNRIPHLAGVPTLYRGTDPAASGSTLITDNPLLLPTKTGLFDPSFLLAGKGTSDASPADLANDVFYTPGNPNAVPQVRFSWETPDVQVNQDWTVAFEGALPGLDGVLAQITTTDGYNSITLGQREAFFCRHGVEDMAQGQARAASVGPALISAKLAPLAQSLGDYVEITDEILAGDDLYWQDPTVIAGFQALPDAAHSGHDFCARTFGVAIAESAARDFPILEAYEDRLVIGRFDTLDVTRKARSAEPYNQIPLRAMQLCFHNQVHFKIRAGGEWLANGASFGALHHVTSDANKRCVQSCTIRESLLNSRAVSLPRPAVDSTGRADFVAPDRNSALAIRNPVFSFVVYDGVHTTILNDASTSTTVLPTRDLSWKFTTAGQFAGLAVNLTAGSVSTSPRSFAFLPGKLDPAIPGAALPLSNHGQFAIVDGSLQGLVLFDLATVSLARSPYL